VIGLVLLSGVVHGMLDGRWSKASDMNEQGQGLSQLPDTCGEWEVVEKRELEQRAAEMLRCFGSEYRVYRHREQDVSVSVVLLFGPRGPIAVHTPEICYDSVGTEIVRERQAEKISTVKNQHQLWSVQFSSDENQDPDLEVWYAWSDGGGWKAAKHPRFWMTDSLYKIQLAGPIGQGGFQPCRDFLDAFLPQVEKVIQ
jgi:hypothetical protein